MFQRLASPSDVAMQFSHAAKAGHRDVQVWQVLSRSAVGVLRYMRMHEIAGVLQSCAASSWRDEYLLCGLAEAFRCAAELRRGTVRDYALVCQALRRLDFVPWDGALKPVTAELRWRLRLQRWRPIDIVYVLRFVAKSGLGQMQAVPQGAALCFELTERAEERLGDMKHLELSHFAAAIADMNQNGQPADLGLLERIAESFARRRAKELPLDALFHFAQTMTRLEVMVPLEFTDLLSQRAQEDLSRMKPFEIAFFAMASARFQMHDWDLLRKLGRAVRSNIDKFTPGQMATVAEAFDILGFKSRPFMKCVEQKLVNGTKGGSQVVAPTHNRCRMLAAVIGAAATDSSPLRDSASACVGELADALAAAVPMAVSTSSSPLLSPPQIHISPRPPLTVRRKTGPRGGRRSKPPKALDKKEIPRSGKLDLDEGFLDGLREIEVSLSSHPSMDPPPPRGQGLLGIGLISDGARRSSKSGRTLEVPSFAPVSATVVRLRTPERRHFERILGGRHPANRRIQRKLIRLEKELHLSGEPAVAAFVQKSETRKEDEDQKSNKIYKTWGPTTNPRARAAILWRKVRRYRLAGFHSGQSRGHFVRQGARAAPSRGAVRAPREDILKSEQAVALAESLATPGGLSLPGCDMLLRRLGEYCAWILVADNKTGAKQQRAVVAKLGRLATALAISGISCPTLLAALGSQLVAAPLLPRGIAASLVDYAALADLGEQEGRDRRVEIRLFKQLLAPGPRPHGSSLRALPSADLASVLAAACPALGDRRSLHADERGHLRSVLQARLSVEPSIGEQPPPAGVLLHLLAAWVWARRPTEPTAAVRAACLRWAVPLEKVLATATVWRSGKARAKHGDTSLPPKVDA